MTIAPVCQIKFWRDKRRECRLVGRAEAHDLLFGGFVVFHVVNGGIDSLDALPDTDDRSRISLVLYDYARFTLKLQFVLHLFALFDIFLELSVVVAELFQQQEAVLLPGRKQNCLLLLKQLSDNNRELKKYVEQSKEVQDKLKLEREPCIIIKNKAYPGTVISIRKSIKRIDSPIDNVKYYEAPEEKIMRFSPAD